LSFIITSTLSSMNQYARLPSSPAISHRIMACS
jgi:hypothetical protein